MCNLTEECDAGQEAQYTEDAIVTGGATIQVFGCTECGAEEAL